MVNAGNSWITPGGPLWVQRIWNAARRGEITRETLEENVTWLLRGMGATTDLSLWRQISS
ncbi:MAG: hypothetical protein IJH03_05890, partial [Clostridia bacterium]|nr:hypothetical protein [Clostridia bacterium]